MGTYYSDGGGWTQKARNHSQTIENGIRSLMRVSICICMHVSIYVCFQGFIGNESSYRSQSSTYGRAVDEHRTPRPVFFFLAQWAPSGSVTPARSSRDKSKKLTSECQSKRDEHSVLPTQQRASNTGGFYHVWANESSESDLKRKINNHWISCLRASVENRFQSYIVKP